MYKKLKNEYKEKKDILSIITVVNSYYKKSLLRCETGKLINSDIVTE